MAMLNNHRVSFLMKYMLNYPSTRLFFGLQRSSYLATFHKPLGPATATCIRCQSSGHEPLVTGETKTKRELPRLRWRNAICYHIISTWLYAELHIMQRYAEKPWIDDVPRHCSAPRGHGLSRKRNTPSSWSDVFLRPFETYVPILLVYLLHITCWKPILWPHSLSSTTFDLCWSKFAYKQNMSQNIPCGNDCYIAIENGQFIVDLPIKDGVDFPQLCFICFPIYGKIRIHVPNHQADYNSNISMMVY